MIRNWKRMAWLSWKTYYKNRYGKEYTGEPCLTDDELKIEWFMVTIEGKERKQKITWNGQESADKIYEG